MPHIDLLYEFTGIDWPDLTCSSLPPSFSHSVLDLLGVKRQRLLEPEWNGNIQAAYNNTSSAKLSRVAYLEHADSPRLTNT